MENVVDYITKLYKEKYPSYPDPTDNELHEFITDEMKKVWWGKHEQHRWYTVFWSVYKLPDERYIQITNVICDENQDYYDCLNFSKDNILEVFPKEVTTTIYVTKEEMNKD